MDSPNGASRSFGKSVKTSIRRRGLLTQQHLSLTSALFFHQASYGVGGFSAFCNPALDPVHLKLGSCRTSVRIVITDLFDKTPVPGHFCIRNHDAPMRILFGAEPLQTNVNSQSDLLMIFWSLFFFSLNLGSQSRKFLLNLFITAVQMINAVHFGRALSSKASQNQGRTRPQIGSHYRRTA